MSEIRTILFDVDGVLIKPPHFFSRDLGFKGYEDAESALNSYYCGGDHLPTLIGEAQCTDVITPYLLRFGWRLSAEEYLQQQFDFEKAYLDREMMDAVSQLRRRGIRCCLATDQEECRALYLLHDMSFGTHFDEQFISCFIGARKVDLDFWHHVLESTSSGHDPGSILFFDDVQQNIDTAAEVGIDAVLFESVEGFNNVLECLGLLQ